MRTSWSSSAGPSSRCFRYMAITSALRILINTPQATWLIHLGLLPSSTLPPTRAALLFSWHIAGLFSVHLLTLLVYSQCKSSPRVPAKSLPSPSESASQLVGLIYIFLLNIQFTLICPYKKLFSQTLNFSGALQVSRPSPWLMPRPPLFTHPVDAK